MSSSDAPEQKAAPISAQHTEYADVRDAARETSG
jgi:hypothetical protein